MIRRGAEASADPSLDLRGWLARRGSLAVADQAVASLTGMITHVWLARALSPEHYGLFAISQSVYGFMVDGFGVVFGEPMMVLAPGRFADHQVAYLKTLVLVYALGAALATLAMVLGYPVLQRTTPAGLAEVVLAMAFAAPGMLLLQLVRRICSARFQLQTALWIGLLALAASLGALWLQQRSRPLTAANAYLALGGAAAAVSVGGLAVLGLLGGRRSAEAGYREVWREHAPWAIWGVPNVAARWFPINAYYVLLPILQPGAAGLAAAAQLRVVMTLIMPMLQLQAALSSSLISTLARRAGSAATGAGRVLAFVWTAAFVYTLALALAGPALVPALFGANYAPSAVGLWLGGVTLLASGAASVLRTTLLALEQPRRVFVATTVSALVTVTFGVYTTRVFGVVGALLGMGVASTVQALAMGFALRASKRAASQGKAL